MSEPDNLSFRMYPRPVDSPEWVTEADGAHRKLDHCIDCGRLATRFHGDPRCDSCFDRWWPEEVKRRDAADVCVYCGKDPCSALVAIGVLREDIS